MTDYITVANVGEIPDQEGRAFKVDDVMVAVFNDAGSYRAIDDMCPHAGASLATGFYDKDSVTCPWHAWRFSVCDGTFCENPRLKIDVYDVRIVGDEIQVSKLPRGAESESTLDSETTPTSDPANGEESSAVNPNG